jgi:5-methylcytosine-specific restriction endonuclease McrA
VTWAFPKPRPRLLDKRKAKADKATDWRKVRIAVLARDKHRCRACSASHGLDVHHVIMRSLGGSDLACNLITLCRGCHESAHGHVLIVRWRDQTNPAGTVTFEWVK